MKNVKAINNRKAAEVKPIVKPIRAYKGCSRILAKLPAQTWTHEVAVEQYEQP